MLFVIGSGETLVIAAYCKPENKVSLEFGEGSNNKIRIIHRRAYALRDEGHLQR